MLVNMWNNRNSHSLLEGMQNSTTTWQFLTELNIFLLNPAVALPGIHPKKRKRMSTQRPAHGCFKIALFIIVKT